MACIRNTHGFEAIALALILVLFAGPARAQSAGDIHARNLAAGQFISAGRYQEGLVHATETLARAEAALGRDDPTTLVSVHNLGAFHHALGHYPEAATLFARALEARERVLGRESPETLTSAGYLGVVYQAMARNGEAEPLYVRTLTGFARILGRDHPQTLAVTGHLASLYQATGRYAAAEPYFVRVLQSSQRTLGADHPNTLTWVNNLATLRQLAGRFAEAELLYARVNEANERTLGRDHTSTLLSVGNLGSLYVAMGRYAEAERLLERALEGAERVLGPNNSATLRSANNLASLYDFTGRYAEAEPLLVRALHGRERSLGRNHPDTVQSMNNLGLLYTKLGRYTEAEVLLLRALDIGERVLGRDDPLTFFSMDHLATLYFRTRRYTQSEPLFVRELEGRERVLGRDHPTTIIAVNNLAGQYRATRRYGDAERLLVRALQDSERVLGPDHPDTLVVMSNLAGFYEGRDRREAAEELQRRAISRWSGRYRRGAIADQDRTAAELAVGYGDFELALVARLGAAASRPAQSAALVATQVGRAEAAGAALQAASARFAAGQDRVADLIRARDVANGQLVALEAQLTQAFVQNRSADVTALTPQIEAARRETETAADAIVHAFPDYTDLVATDFIDLDELQGDNGLLAPGEALLTLVEAETTGLVEAAWFAMLVTRDRVAVKQLPSAPAGVAARIAALRAQTTPVNNRPPAAFDLAVAHQLYRDLIAPLEPDLAGITRLLVVPDGPLQSLPLELLVVVPPPAGVSEDDAYRQATWLGDRYEIAVLPSVSALRALRRHAGRSAAPNPLIAFADPAFGAAARQNLLASLSSTAGAVSDVCALASVPATARIGESLRRALGADAGALLLGRDASEARLHQLNASGALRQARIIAFNTHGLTAGEAHIAPEPALALSPDGGCGRDARTNREASGDGLLTTSEIVGLNLDADWVLLTACNTAAPDGASGAEPLSGLARAFFYAGARALLVSHWPALVSNDPNVEGPTELLIAELFAPARSTLSKAAALSQARQAVRERFPHPAYWVAFALVGDGR